jgi:hypothetical protein
MKNIFSLFAFIVLLSVSYVSSAQKVLDKGTVKMEITKVASEDPQMEMMLGAMKGSQTELVFNGDKHISTMDMMGGMVKVKVLVNKTDNSMNMLFDAMGNKSWIESKLDQSQSAQEKEIASKSVITYDKNDSKEILGYKCYKMTVKNPELEDMTVTGYVTSDIKTKANLIQGFQSLEFEGYPMEFTVGSKQFTMTMTAVEVSDKVDDSKFAIDTKGYKKQTMEEFQKSMGGMGGFGF